MLLQALRHKKRATAHGYEGEHFSLEEWAELLEACGHRCLRCGSRDEPLTVDHIVPLSSGGSNTIDAIQVLCEPCNIAKGTTVRDYRPASLRRNSSSLAEYL